MNGGKGKAEQGGMLAGLCQFQDKKIPDRVIRGRARPGLSWSGGKGYRPKRYFPKRVRKMETQIRGTKKATLQMLINQ